MTAFQIPTPPSSNNMFSTTSSLRRVRAARYAEWARRAGWEIQRQRAAGLIIGPFSAPVYIRIDTMLPRRRDLDNAIKAALDLLVRLGILVDDNLVDRLEVRRCGSSDCATVLIRPIEADDLVPLHATIAGMAA